MININTNEISTIEVLNRYYDDQKYLLIYKHAELLANNNKQLKKANDSKKEKLIEINKDLDLALEQDINLLDIEYENIKLNLNENIETKYQDLRSLKADYRIKIKNQKKQLKLANSKEENAVIKNNINNLKFNKIIDKDNLTKNKQSFLSNVGKRFVKIGLAIKNKWRNFKIKHPNLTQFLVFFLISNGVTVLQLALMPIFKSIFNQTNLINISFQFGQIGNNFDGTPYYMFNYASGAIVNGIGGGLAYFLAVQITLTIAQIINFFSQRSITFKSNSNVWVAAAWYLLAYIIITFIAAAAQGFYKAPIYNLFMNTLQMGNSGELVADFITMIINSAISFWVFFPIFKVIFKTEEKQ